jgi:uncharacterized protein (DUF1330 family)
MPAYAIALVEILQPERYPEYKEKAQKAVEAFDGRYIARGGRAEVLEGEWQPRRVVILEFPNMGRAREWWSSEQYREAKALRQAIAQSTILLVEGLEPR